jgi:hypothetical protein
MVHVWHAGACELQSAWCASGTLVHVVYKVHAAHLARWCLWFTKCTLHFWHTGACDLKSAFKNAWCTSTTLVHVNYTVCGALLAIGHAIYRVHDTPWHVGAHESELQKCIVHVRHISASTLQSA